MKATQRDFARVAAKAAGQWSILFLCGPDEAGAWSAAEKAIATLPEPGEREELSGGDLRADPVRLVDEARSTSLFGGARHILVRASGDEAHDAVKAFVDMADIGQTDGACPVVIVAASATDKSRTAKLLEKRDDAIVGMFHPPDLSSVTAEVRSMADAAGLRLAGELAESIARAARLDVRLARSEIDKLALYCDASPQSPKLADAEALAAVGAVSEEDGFAPLVDAVLSGQTRKLPSELARLREMSLNPVGVLLALERRAGQLAGLTARHGPGADIGNLSNADLRMHGIFWRDKREVAEQARRWSGRRLERLSSRLADLHRALLGNSAMAELLLTQGLAEIARFASTRRN